MNEDFFMYTLPLLVLATMVAWDSIATERKLSKLESRILDIELRPSERVVFFGEEMQTAEPTKNAHMTNADKIRAMTDEELEDLLRTTGVIGCSVMGDWHEGMCSKPCSECWLAWLKQEVNE